MTDPDLTHDLDAVVAALKAADRVLIATHENPDGDAVGSLTAAEAALRGLGKQVRTFIHADSTIPIEVSFLETKGLEREIDPATVEGWTLLALDCGNERRIGPGYEGLLEAAATVIDIDHHHDNSRFGDVNLIDGTASSTAEILAHVFDELGAEITPKVAESLYVGLVTDTGRFQYRTTSPAALRLAARLVEAGADVHKVFELVFERTAFSKFKLRGALIDNTELFQGGRLAVSSITRENLAAVTGDEATTEGLIDDIRAIEGVEVAAVIREQVPLDDGSIPDCRVSLRSRGGIDVSVIARKSSGGGHKQAAGFSHAGTIDEIRAFIVDEVSAQLAAPAA